MGQRYREIKKRRYRKKIRSPDQRAPRRICAVPGVRKERIRVAIIHGLLTSENLRFFRRYDVDLAHAAQKSFVIARGVRKTGDKTFFAGNRELIKISPGVREAFPRGERKCLTFDWIKDQLSGR